MASITIRNLDDAVKTQLRIVAAHHGHSMEEEARTILRTVLSSKVARNEGLASKIHQRFRSLDVDNIESVQRKEPVRFVEFDG